MPDDFDALVRQYGEIRDLENALSILGWDQEVVMPPGGAEPRAHVMAALSGLLHERLTDGSLQRLTARLARRAPRLPRPRRRAVELARRKVARAARIPNALARELAAAESRGLESWRAARKARDFARFRPDLEHMVGLKQEVARLTARGGRLYDALLDDYEPGATTTRLDALLGELREVTVPLLRQVVAKGGRSRRPGLPGPFPVEAQRAFARQVVTAMGIDLERGRMDLSTHPFCSGVAPGDVRMTGRYDERDLRGGFFGAVHEAGHGLYEQGLSPRRARHPLGGAVSMGLHESQSRLWENNVARSRPFWRAWLPRLRAAFPHLRRTSLEQVVTAVNVLGPSFIRVEADELTYNLHIVLRYEIERDLIEGQLAVKDLPRRWNRGMAELLGLTPAHDGEGVLQDIHWAMGYFGYFPTYSLGNLYAAQFMEAAHRDIPGLDRRLARGDLGTLRRWLLQRIHRHDQLYSAEETVRRVTGRPLSVDAFARHIGAKVLALYG